jgi:hypothetical protein
MLLDLNLLCLQVSILLNVIKLAAAAAPAASLVSPLNVVKLLLLLQV